MAAASAANDPKVVAENRHPITEVGVGATIDLLTSIATREKSLGNGLEVFTSDFQFAGKTTTRYEILARRAHAHRYAYRMLAYVDKETKLIVRFEAYDAPKAGTIAGEGSSMPRTCPQQRTWPSSRSAHECQIPTAIAVM